jgi:isoleucyl-tRNA synthetase
MSRYPAATGFDHASTEEEVLRRWDETSVFQRSLDLREGRPPFVFYEGPPTANGKPGIHHVLSRTIKDLFCRYKTMKGFRVDRKAGWDTHGLPVEIEVEKELGLEGRHQVEEFGVAAYNAACRKSVLRYKDQWDDLTRRMGYWVDLSDPYVTFQNRYIESVWHLLKRISERRTRAGESFLYRGYKIQWYSPGSGTVLSSHEVSLGYREVQDPSVYVRFPVVGEADTYFLAWTTTPWTLPSNTALAVGPDLPYVRVRKPTEDGAEEFFYLAQARLAALREEVEVVEEMPGRALLGKTYDPPFDVFTGRVSRDEAWRVVPADFVTTDDGTGIVHMAPAFGADDFVVGQREALPLLNPISSDGTFTDEVPMVAGMWFKDADRVLARDLRERGLMYRHETTLHNYPHDWRKGTPLMSYPVESWFIRTTAIKDRLIELNRTINWQPEGIGEGRFGQWLENNVDWAISRMRYWGTPLPIWVNDRDPDDAVVVGSVGELRQRVGADFPAGAINP